MRKIPLILILVFTTLGTLKASKVEYSYKEDAFQVSTISESEVQQLADRIYEIKTMDKSSLSSTERYALKHELKSIQSKLNAYFDGGGLYIGGGALLVILILLILLL